MSEAVHSCFRTLSARLVEHEKRVRDLQEELARKDERLRHYEEELLRARRFEAEDAGPRHKAMERAVDFRAKECNERKHEMELAEIVQKFNNLETKIDALMKAGSEREEEVTWKDRKLLLYKLELNRRENLETKVQDVFRLLRNKEREFNDLQSQVTLKNLLIERLGAELNSAARELTRRNEINIERDNKIQALEDQLRYYRMKSDRAERDNQPLRCITRMLKQNDACNSYLDYEAKHQDGTTSDKVILMESSTINDRRASSAVSDHISDEPNGPKGAQLQLKKTDDNLSTNTFAAGRVKNYSLAELVQPLHEQRQYNVKLPFGETAVSSIGVSSKGNRESKTKEPGRPCAGKSTRWKKKTKRWLVQQMKREQNVQSKCSQSIQTN